MSKYLIEGGVPLKGKVRISGAKNAAIKEIAAALLTTAPVVLNNVPEIGDVFVDVEIMKALGVEVSKPRSGALLLRSSPKLRTTIPAVLSGKSRVAIIAMGPLLAREGKVSLSAPGGCPVAERPLDRHLAALESLGASFVVERGIIKGTASKLIGGKVVFEKNTVMGTENAILAAVLAEGETEIRGAAQEPEVDDLIELLVKMGARVERDSGDSRLIRIQGVSALGGGKHAVLPDRIEAATFAIAAAVTQGDVTLTNLKVAHLTAFLAKMEKAGVRYSIERGGDLRITAGESRKFKPVDITTAPYPGFMTDWQQPFSVILALADGESLIHETIFENRLGYLSELKKFGVEAKTLTPAEVGRPFDPKGYGFDWPSRRKQPRTYARIAGPAILTGARATVRDLRAGATLVLAALAAEGESEIDGVEHIERGYEHFEEKLRGLGAEIAKVQINKQRGNHG